ncbi:elongation factor G [Candidatus Saganbacteria bacterium]|uniref:Elongation factor G n=1 Tax=Candidatus Saganbacteria bacterium TaxID=2575572 RepID=A0A9D6UM44_UNCSA|nr:elongation factor G [Candidatus Saganbacteria bacterium]
MKAYPPEKIRNVAVIGSGGAGKTTLSEALLYKSGAIPRMGKIDEGSTVSDYEGEEIKRKISLRASLLPLEWKDHKINLIDSPGYIEFAGEAIAALSVTEGVVIVIDAVSGAGVGIDALWQEAGKLNLPKIVVINKLDKNQADFSGKVEEARKKLGKQLVPIQVPVGNEANFSGIYNLLKPDGVPEEIKTDFESFREMLIETTAEVDDAILSEYLENKEIPEEEIISAIKTGIKTGKITPILCASAVKDIGITELLDEMLDLFPPPNKNPRGTGPGTSAFVFKTMIEPHIGELSFVRVYAGEIKPSSSLYNLNKGKEERIGQISTLRGKVRIDLPTAVAGDIVVLPKLKITQTGDTLCDKNLADEIPPTVYPEPVASLSVKPKSKADQEKMAMGFSAFMHEDPTFKMHYEAETRETVIYGMGDIHLEVMLARLRERYNIVVETGAPRIPYKETIKGKAKGQGKYKKQTGGHGQYGDTWLEIEPLPRGKGFEFIDKIVGGTIPKNYIPAVEKGVREAMTAGVIAGYPVIDVRVTLYDGSYHDVDSSDLAFKIAASMGFKKIFQEANPSLIEPIVEITIYAPPEFIGDVTGDINKRRGKILSIESDKVTAKVPLAELTKYAADLRSFTHGRGTYTYKFSHYEEAPAGTREKLVAVYQKLKAEGDLAKV